MQFAAIPTEVVIRVGDQIHPISAEFQLKPALSDVEGVEEVELIAVEIAGQSFQLVNRQGYGFRTGGSGLGLAIRDWRLSEVVDEVQVGDLPGHASGPERAEVRQDDDREPPVWKL